MTKSEFKAIEKLFIEHRNPAKIEQMTKYMKGRFLYLGITSPERKELLRNIFTGFKWDRAQFLDFARHAWESEFRELHYAATDMLQKHAKKLKIDDLSFLEFLVTTHSWWDSVDTLAANPIGEVLKRDQLIKEKWVKKWADSDNIWLKRTAILHQLKYKDKVDLELLEYAIKRANGTKEFFLNKAIGWILRQYSRTDPQYVINFCNNNELSNLSRREALRLIT